VLPLKREEARVLLVFSARLEHRGTVTGKHDLVEERDIVVIGASAGGVEAVALVIEELPRNLAAAVFVVVHFPPHTTSVLPRIITRRGGMTAMHPEDGAPIELGCVYVAPPDRHLLVEHGHVRLVRGPRENGARPAVDPLFRSAARAYGARVIGVVLTGNLDDGTAGLMAIKSAGGLAIVQHPDDALYAGMPSSALRHVQPDHVAPLGEIPGILVRRVGEQVEQKGAGPVAQQQNHEVDISEMDRGALEGPRDGVPSGYACPECHGALWEVDEGGLLRFRCRVGHAYSIENLLRAGLVDGCRPVGRLPRAGRARRAHRAHERAHEGARTDVAGPALRRADRGDAAARRAHPPRAADEHAGGAGAGERPPGAERRGLTG
jgi:two-component system, chemotaxis family, protein-glutamate methylesterase/glutaminase